MHPESTGLTAVVTCEAEWFVARCPELGVTARGETAASALRNLDEAVRLSLEREPGPRTKPRGPSPIASLLLQVLRAFGRAR